MVGDPALLLVLTKSLKDKRLAVVLVESGTYLRVCELALEQLTRHAGIDVGIDVHQRSARDAPMPRYTDQDLDAAYVKLHAHFAGLPT